MNDTLWTIRPLKWEASKDGTSSAWASTIFCTLHVNDDGEGSFSWSFCVDEFYDEGKENCLSLVDGMMKAEAWYRGRLLPALEQFQPTTALARGTRRVET